MYEVYQKVLKIAEGAALMTGTTYEIKLVSGMHEILINRTGAEALQKNLELLGDITYTEQETAFAKAIQEATNKPQVGIDGTVKPLRVTEKDPPGGSTELDFAAHHHECDHGSQRHALAFLGGSCVRRHVDRA
jgi:aminobenzoyl-glutamate utilization protein B